MKLSVIQMELADANDFVARLHRHHKPVQGHRYSIGVADESGSVRGVAIVGRPVSRMVNRSAVVEVTRLCTDGCKNACSALYSACARAAKELGYKKIQTYILESEPGTSLRAAGWNMESTTDGGSWSRDDRKRDDKHPLERKQRWARVLT